MCDGYTSYSKQNYMRKQRIFWKVAGKSLTFYKAFGKGCCMGCTDWCTSHCYMNISSFLSAEIKEQIMYSKEMPWIDRFDRLSFESIIASIEYVTFFGSGTITSVNDIEFIKTIIKRYPDKKYRIFTRTANDLESFYGQLLIMSVDKDTNRQMLEKSLRNKNINIAVLNHPDNVGLINELKPKLKTVIECSKCLAEGCKHLCFYEDNKFLLIENYVEGN